MKLNEFIEKNSEIIKQGEDRFKQEIERIQSLLNDTNIKIKITLRIGKWSKRYGNFYRWNSSIKIDVQNTNSDYDFNDAVKKVSQLLSGFRFTPKGLDPQFFNFSFEFHKSTNFRRKQLESENYKEYNKWIGRNSQYPGDHNSESFLPKIKLIKGNKPDSESSGERTVRLFLMDNKIKFKQYHKIKGCFSEKNGKQYPLIFDFYLPKINCVIEYDGAQHFRPVEIFGGEETYKRTLILDQIKNKFCSDNNIKIIRLSYELKPNSLYKLLKSELNLL
jgi:hypothetical protein